MGTQELLAKESIGKLLLKYSVPSYNRNDCKCFV